MNIETEPIESAVIPIERQNHTDLHKLIDERDFKDRLDLLLETLMGKQNTLSASV
jgi:hypothetical protein